MPLRGREGESRVREVAELGRRTANDDPAADGGTNLGDLTDRQAARLVVIARDVQLRK